LVTTSSSFVPQQSAFELCVCQGFQKATHDIRLSAAGILPLPSYLVLLAVPTHEDARFVPVFCAKVPSCRLVAGPSRDGGSLLSLATLIGSDPCEGTCDNSGPTSDGVRLVYRACTLARTRAGSSGAAQRCSLCLLHWHPECQVAARSGLLGIIAGGLHEEDEAAEAGLEAEEGDPTTPCHTQIESLIACHTAVRHRMIGPIWLPARPEGEPPHSVFLADGPTPPRGRLYVSAQVAQRHSVVRAPGAGTHGWCTKVWLPGWGLTSNLQSDKSTTTTQMGMNVVGACASIRKAMTAMTLTPARTLRASLPPPCGSNSRNLIMWVPRSGRPLLRCNHFRSATPPGLRSVSLLRRACPYAGCRWR
jgi:hypothetical protein